MMKILINRFGDDHDKKQLDDYEKKFKKFALKRLPKGNKHIEVGSGARRGGTQLIIKIDKEWNGVNFDDLKKIRGNFASILGVHRRELYLADVREGCIMMMFMISEELAERLFLKQCGVSSSKLSNYFTICQIKSLRDEGVILLTCGKLSWQFATVEKEPELQCSEVSGGGGRV